MADQHSTESFISIPEEVAAGPNAYALGIVGNHLAPEIIDGDKIVFDPDASPPMRGDVVAIWWKKSDKPSVAKLRFALPPKDLWESHSDDEVTALIVCEQTNPHQVFDESIHEVRAVHRMIYNDRRV